MEFGSNRCILFLSLATQFGLSLEPSLGQVDPLSVVAEGVSPCAPGLATGLPLLPGLG